VQPLYVPNLIVGGRLHNVLYVASQHDTVYAFDAGAGQALLTAWWRWHRHGTVRL
jgi:hypothetical protein